MKIIFLNTLNGDIRDKISEFIQIQSKDTDIFCFQEAYDKMRCLARELLPDYSEYSAYKFVQKDDDFPQAIYIRKNINILSSGTILEGQEKTGLGIYHEIGIEGKNIFIINFHGISKPGQKLDSPERTLQSESLLSFLEKLSGPKIIGGDFNLDPDTRSRKMFKENGLRDLIEEYAIKTTRNRLAWELYPDTPQYHSNYLFLSPEIQVKSFSVIENEISDHLPMVLEFEL
jgi:hypothetical protein